MFSLVLSHFSVSYEEGLVPKKWFRTDTNGPPGPLASCHELCGIRRHRISLLRIEI